MIENIQHQLIGDKREQLQILKIKGTVDHVGHLDQQVA